jgi:hypothetical protein
MFRNAKLQYYQRSAITQSRDLPGCFYLTLSNQFQNHPITHRTNLAAILPLLSVTKFLPLLTNAAVFVLPYRPEERDLQIYCSPFSSNTFHQFNQYVFYRTNVYCRLSAHLPGKGDFFAKMARHYRE